MKAKKGSNSIRLLAILFAAASDSARAFTTRRGRPMPPQVLVPTSSTNARRSSASTTTGLLGHQNDREGGESKDAPSSSVGDVVGNLHGGKYQFSESQYLAGSSATGRQFAESLYSGGGDDSTAPGDEDDEDAELPNWARRLRDPTEQLSKPVRGTLAFDGGRNGAHTVTIANDERSWERYHVFLLPLDGGGRGFEASPTTGTLAPRGGASNACDELRPYSDGATISVEWSGARDRGEKAGECLMVAGTEAEAWRYRLKFTSQ